jgi:mannose-6-phosphate isomerase-like protein (cupin superfamily)
MVKITTPKRVEKSWGYELWIHNDNQYCGKLLVFPEAGNKFSMHYHMIKNETWYVQSGNFEFCYIDTENGTREITFLSVGDVVYIERGLPHQLKALLDDSVIMEVSTEHFDFDSYRIYRDTPKDLE